MKQLTVLYDPTCGMCVRCRGWLAKQPKLIDLRFVPMGSSRQRDLYPSLEARTDEQGRPDEMVVIDDGGNIYREDKAWVMCFYALRNYRALSMRMARPGAAALARRAYTLISANRRGISKLCGMAPDEAISILENTPDTPRCHNAIEALKRAKERAADEMDETNECECST